MPAKPGLAGQEPVSREFARHEEIAELLVGAQAGKRAALAELVRQLTPMLWHVARAQGVDREASFDVVQTTWLELLGSLAKIRNPMALTAWLITVTKREAWRVRHANRPERIEDGSAIEHQPDTEPGPAERVIDEDRRRQLWAAVDTLPAVCRTLLRIVAFADRPSYAAVADALGMPAGSIGPNRGRCLAKLRTVLMSDPAGGWQ